MKRVAFTFIELVFSIVIVGIVILSIPLIVRQSNANTIESQNVIGYYNALTLMETIKNKPWDTNNVSDFEKSGEYYILFTDDTTHNCKQDPIYTNIYTKPGLGLADRRRMCDPEQKTATAITRNTNLASINAFNEFSQRVSSGGNDFFIVSVSIKYVNVNFGTGTTAGSITDATRGTTDVKAITVRLHRVGVGGAANELISSYIYYAANIGSDVPFAKDNV
ncbi:hypothetical protein CCY99_05885 [Helicobacter sp. 16-1353]|uniref:type II secretion system protein n=1 Tax=Helicobacter sp. 16-1353 TaxID=2004996 RepID=UPI000DCBA3C3|nr:type II secretion system protein [Helicobacter sp. 16-1353]RAX53120.1 hypothetical protein CCY99_05885 [Helicobacter sp. 16-1353]